MSKVSDEDVSAAIEENIDADGDGKKAEKSYVVLGRALTEAMDELGGRPNPVELVFGVRTILKARHKALLETPPAVPRALIADKALLDEAVYNARYALAVYEKNVDKCMEFLSMRRDQVATHDWSVTVGRPVYCVIRDEARKRLYFVIRGTFSISDAITDVVCLPEPFHGDHAHRGMATAAEWFFKNQLSTIQTEMAANPDWDLYVTGHSLGAGSSALFTMLLSDVIPKGKLHCWAFATPACASEVLAAKHADKIISVVNDADVVPRFSLHAAEHARREIKEVDWKSDVGADIAAERARMVERLKKSRTFNTVSKSRTAAKAAALKSYIGETLESDAAVSAKARAAAAAKAAKAGAGVAAAKGKSLAGKAAKKGKGFMSRFRKSDAGAGAGAGAEEADTAAAADADITKPIPSPMVPPGRVLHLNPIGEDVYVTDKPCMHFARVAWAKTMVGDHSMELYLPQLERAAARLG